MKLLAPDTPHLAVAVSGGPDSMALCLLLADWAKSTGKKITAITVDHALRPESNVEAAQVGAWLGALGITHTILRWQHHGINANIQAVARQARYGLLRDYCCQHSITHFCTAHHQGDVVENFLQRLERGSGVYGLAAMADQQWVDGICQLRPILTVEKTTLLDYLRTHNQPYITDASNTNPRFGKTQIRNTLAALHPLGITAHTLSATANRLQRARDALDWMLRDLLRTHTRRHRTGWLRLDLLAWRQWPEELADRGLMEIIAQTGGDDYPPRHESIARLRDELCATTVPVKQTLGGCIIDATATHADFMREPDAITQQLSIPPATRKLWDGRFWVENNSDQAWWIEKLGVTGWAAVKKTRPEAAAGWPHALRLGLPCLSRNPKLDETRLVPHLDSYNTALQPRLSLRQRPFWLVLPLTQDNAF